MNKFTRRNFLKLSLLGLLGSGFSPGFPTYAIRRTKGLIGRIAADDKTISIYEKPDYESPIVRDTTFDELIHLYYEQEILQENDPPQYWYRVWGGYLPGVYVQQTRYR